MRPDKNISAQNALIRSSGPNSAAIFVEKRQILFELASLGLIPSWKANTRPRQARANGDSQATGQSR
jgi:hypothetical protein